MMNAALPMMKRPAAILSSALLSCLLLASCSSIPMPSFLHSPASEAVVYALGPRDGFTSPLNGSLKPACPALVFENADFQLTSAHQQALNSLAQEMNKNKKARLLVAGYTAPNLPPDHARSLSERRALAVRQRLIELGLDAANVQTVGFGNDFSPSGPSSDVVVIYRQ
ncbi:OmpA family protein [Prosthecobacter sp.]|uniref:OmpA family protein n=1 Tax=Prosthecobacter sp. TaxID=1965333 RepID=UPI0026363BD0|nr:OmpA family protein [Prosthecobacter sp.]